MSNNMISNYLGAIFHQSPAHPFTLFSFAFALGLVVVLFLLSQDKFTPSGRFFIWKALAKLTFCTEILFLIALMHNIFGVVCSWLPYGRPNESDIESARVRSRVVTRDEFHYESDNEEQWVQAPAPAPNNVMIMLHIFLMEVLDRVWEEMVVEEEPEQRLRVIQAQAFTTILEPLLYYKGGLEATVAGFGNDRCAICLEDFEDGESCRVFECKHIFHVSCIDLWLMTSLTCPICRHSVLNIT